MKKFILYTTVLLFFFPHATAGPYSTLANSRTALFRQEFRSQRTIKSGTPELIRLISGKTARSARFLAEYQSYGRPVMHTFADSPGGNFRVHYDINGPDAPNQADTGGNGIPDYVDSTMAFLDRAWEVLVEELGYTPPISDGNLGGSGHIDCYLQDISPDRYYGVTYPDIWGPSSVSSYMVIDNDFSEAHIYPTRGYDALRVTTAHEFFHVIHYTYYAGNNINWWMEQTAVWAEEVIWDDVNDYLHYLGYIFGTSQGQNARDLPIDTANGQFEYAAGLFPIYLSGVHGNDIIRSAWDSFRSGQTGSVNRLNNVIPGGLADALSGLATWMYFTGPRANYDFFPDAPRMPGISPERTLTDLVAAPRDTINFNNYTFKYIFLNPQGGIAYGDTLGFDFTELNGGNWSRRLILYENPQDYSILPFDSNTIVVPDRNWQRGVVVIANAGPQRSGSYRVSYMIRNTHVDSPQPAQFLLHQNRPNPFNNTTSIPYELTEPAHVLLKIVNSRGQIVRVLVDELRQPGEHFRQFDATDLSSGVYFAVMEAEGIVQSIKMMFVK